MNNIYNYTKQDLENYFLEIGETKFRAAQVFDWLYIKRVTSFDLMTNLKKDLIKYLKENFNIDKGVIKTEDSVDDNIGKDLEQKYTEIVEEFKIPIEDENSTRKEVDECLKTLKIGMGTMFSEFMKKQRNQE